MLNDYNLYPLHVFRLVARSGGVTRAAEELRISQPAVSAHLRTLEERIGEPLFERTPRGMLLTKAGEIILDQASRLLALYEELPSAVNAARGQVRGEVTVAASSTPGAYCVPELLRRFQEKYPEAQPRLIVGDSAQVLGWLRDYRAPVGVIGEMVMDEELYRMEIGADVLQLVAAASDTICRVRQVKPQHLKGRTLFLREVGSSTRSGAESLLGALLKEFGRVVEISSAEAIRESVVSGLGVAVLSSWATRLEEEAGLLKPVRDPRLRRRRRFYLVRRRTRVLTGAAAALWECLSACKR
ncbi:MAG: LysR substrate-binding domain-containing protein [Blastocatellia bacterium]